MFEPRLVESLFPRDARRFDCALRLDVGLLQRTVALDLEPTRLALGFDAFDCDLLLLRDPRPLGRLARRDLRLLQRLAALDLQAAGLALRGNPFRVDRLLLRDPRSVGRLARCDLRLLQRLAAFDLQAAGLAIRGDALDANRFLLCDARPLGRLRGADLRLLQSAGALDLAPAGRLLLLDTQLGQGPLLRDAGLLGLALRRDLRCLNRTLALDLQPLGLFLRRDARLGNRALLRNPRLLDLLASADLRRLDRAGALDVALAGRLLGRDAGRVERLFVRDPRLLGLFPGEDLGLLGLGLALRALAGEIGALRRAPDLDVAFLIEARRLALALDLQRLLLRLEVAGADPDHRVLLDVVARLAAGLDLLDEPGEALRVKPVGRVEVLQVGLIELGDGDRFKLQAVHRKRLGGVGPHLDDVVAAPLVHLLERHLGPDRTQGADELARQQLVKPNLLHRAPAKGRGGVRDRFTGRRHAHVELGHHVDAHPVLGDERVLLVADHLELDDVHVDRGRLVDDRQHEGAAVDHHLLSPQAGSDERDLLGGAAVEPVHEVDDHRDHDDRDDEPQDYGANHRAGHERYLPCVILTGALFSRVHRSHDCVDLTICLNRRVCSVSAASTGRRSIEDAP